MIYSLGSLKGSKKFSLSNLFSKKLQNLSSYQWYNFKNPVLCDQLITSTNQNLRSFVLPDIEPSFKKNVKARFTRIDPEEKIKFPHSTGLLYVSIPNVYCENVYFEEILKLIDSYKFKLLKVVVCDVLQVRTRQISNPELSLEETYKQLLWEGSQWIIRHASLFNNVKHTPVFLTKWSDHINSPNFKNNLDRIQNDYKKDIEYQSFLHSNIQSFINRQKKLSVSEQEAFSLCRDYLIEEVAEYLQVMEKSEPHYHIFINKREEALSATAEKYGNHQFKPLAIRFKTVGIKNNNLEIHHDQTKQFIANPTY